MSQEFQADAQAKSLPEILHSNEPSTAKVSISLSRDHLLLPVPLAVASSGTAEASCGNPAAAKYVLVLFSLIVTSSLPPPLHGTSTPLVSVSVN